MATGPSLTLMDVEYCRGKCPVIIVNDNYRMAPWADVLYASDPAWWDHHQGVPEFPGIKITRDVNGGADAAKRWNLNTIHIDIGKKGWSTDPACVHSGGNGGYQAGNLAVLFGATRIILLGFDMRGETHWFGAHPGPINRRHAYVSWLARFAEIKPAGYEIINCTRETALKRFRQSTIEAEL